jgi:hypothetical protein
VAFRDSNLASAGALAAELLVRACGSGDDVHAATVRDLAVDLGGVLHSLGASGTPDSAVEAAIACADLATLAACNVSAIPDGSKPGAVAAAHLAAGTARALAALVEAGIGDEDGAYAENALRDVRSAGWKADLAVGQLGEHATP